MMTAAAARAGLPALEADAIRIIRETVAGCENPALLFSGGKDSAVLLHLARKACWPGALGFPLVHVDTGHNFPEVLAFRDAAAQAAGAELVVASVEASIAAGTVRLEPGEGRNAAQAVTLREAIAANGWDALFGGARRDEDRARAKERVWSHRDRFGRWEPRNQRPELFGTAVLEHRPGEHWRVFPLSDWTEAHVWAYIAREAIALPALYWAHERTVVERDGLLVPVTALTPPRPGETPVRRSVRFRTVGDVTGTCPVPSVAADAEAVLAETLATDMSERGATRMDDRVGIAAMERRKRQGYF